MASPIFNIKVWEIKVYMHITFYPECKILLKFNYYLGIDKNQTCRIVLVWKNWLKQTYFPVVSLHTHSVYNVFKLFQILNDYNTYFNIFIL